MDAYYKKIVYKKNAFEDLKTYIKLNYNRKNILLVSTKSVPVEDVTSILNAIFCGSDSVEHYVARENFSLDELDNINKKINNGVFNLIVSLGGGKCCDVVKYFANLYSIPYVVCPTIATSLSYFTNYCINPYNSTKSFYAEMPAKIFIQEKIIKESSCLSNINGLCFLHSLRCVYLEGLLEGDEKKSHIFMGLEKLFAKLEYEQINILMCNEDSNLVLMDLFIDFGFFIGMLNKEEYYLFNMYFNYLTINPDKNIKYAGQKMLLCAKTIISSLHKYLLLNTTNIIEKVNYNALADVISKSDMSYKFLKNDAYFKNLLQKTYLKIQFLNNRDSFIKLIEGQLDKIAEYCMSVKNVYKYGVEVIDNIENIFLSLFVTPYVYKSGYVIDMLANSGLLNALY